MGFTNFLTESRSSALGFIPGLKQSSRMLNSWFLWWENSKGQQRTTAVEMYLFRFNKNCPEKDHGLLNGAPRPYHDKWRRKQKTGDLVAVYGISWIVVSTPVSAPVSVPWPCNEAKGDPIVFSNFGLWITSVLFLHLRNWTCFAPQKTDGWKMSCLLGLIIFRGPSPGWRITWVSIDWLLLMCPLVPKKGKQGKPMGFGRNLAGEIENTTKPSSSL